LLAVQGDDSGRGVRYGKARLCHAGERWTSHR
jgi:hypothetical protein